MVICQHILRTELSFYYVIVLFSFAAFSFLPLIYGSLGLYGLALALVGVVTHDVYLVKLFLKLARCKVPKEPVEPSGLEVNDVNFLATTVTYLIPFFSTSLLNVEDAIMLVVIALILMLFMFLVMQNSLMPSPFLALLGYHCYKASICNGVGGCLLITKKKIKDPKEVKYVIPIFDYAYLE